MRNDKREFFGLYDFDETETEKKNCESYSRINNFSIVKRDEVRKRVKVCL